MVHEKDKLIFRTSIHQTQHFLSTLLHKGHTKHNSSKMNVITRDTVIAFCFIQTSCIMSTLNDPFS